MSRISIIGSVFLLASACVDDKGESAPRADEQAQFFDAQTNIQEPGRPGPLELQAPVTGTHLDELNDSYYQPTNRNQARRRSDKTIELVLRSTPPGAKASVDGQLVGVTPTYWSARGDGSRHEFTFVKAGHSMARYRFVATHSGVVHGTLEPLTSDKPDASVGPSNAE